MRQTGAEMKRNEAEQAANLLAHYLRTVWEKAGLTWDSDNTSEVELIIEHLLEAARDPS